MTYREAFVEGVRRLTTAEVPTESPDLDSRVLLAHCAQLSHAGLLARWSDPVPPAVLEGFDRALARRGGGEPVAWVVGFKEFLGMDFAVGPGLLVPRADTETLVEAALELWTTLPASKGGTRPRVVDVCTGTGCVAVGLGALAPTVADLWAGDLSPLAVETARRNGLRLLNAPRSLTVVSSDLLEGLPGPWDLVVSNPPYLTPAETSERVGPGGWKEPALALDGGGADGLDLIRRLVAQASRGLVPGGWILLEAAGDQMAALERLLTDEGFGGVRTWTDLAGVHRVVGGVLGAAR